MKLADAFQMAEDKRTKAEPRAHVRTIQPAAKMPANAPQNGPRTGETHITWSDAEWLTVTRELMRQFPEIGLPSPDAVGEVRLKHMHSAMSALPIERRRHLVHLTNVRPRLVQYCARIVEESNRTRPQASPVTPASLPASVVYRQPDGAQDGPPPTGARIYWRESEWYALAVELAYIDPSFLDTLNHLYPADLFRAQRVLPTSRRRPQTSFSITKIRAEMTPAIRRVRVAIDAARHDQVQAELAAQAEETARAEQARQAAEMAAQDAMRAEMAQSPAFIAQALKSAAFGPLVEALMARGAAGLQSMLETALVNAFSSPAVKQAMVVNLHMDRADASAQSFKANPPTVTGATATNTICKPKIGILGALAQQGDIIAAAYPQLRIKHIDKNLTSHALRDAILNCDRVISMTSFISHSMDAIANKAMGDRYTRVDGGVSSVRRQIDVWLAAGTLQTVTVPANEQPSDKEA
jgi:hypothetical protein